MNFDLNLLKVYEALLSEGSATRASVKLGVTQAAVSAALSRLRHVYGDVLFTRTSRGLAPTARALEIAPLVRDAIDAISSSLDPQDDGAERHIRIGLSDDIELAFGPDILASLGALYPRARPVLRQAHSGIAADMLRDRSIDIAIGSGGLTGQGLERQSVGESGYLTLSYVPPRDEAGFSLEEFCERSHLLISSSGVVGAVDDALSAMRRKRHVAASSSHFAAVPFLMRGTGWISTIPAHAARVHAEFAPLWISECPLALKPYPIEVATTVANLRDPLVAQSVDAIAECLRSAIARVSPVP